jgi:hypothetical protein
VEESTPPDMATATRPELLAACVGKVSNWGDVSIKILFYRASATFR